MARAAAASGREGVLAAPGGHRAGFANTERGDAWWVGPLLTILGLGGFAVYGTWRAFQGTHYYAEPYLSPFYSPLLFIDPSAPGAAPLEHAWFGAWPAWWPAFLPISPALLILIFPGAFRATCYYYRKAYYRSFFGTPPGCAVCPVALPNYRGETRLFLFQNLHRYALYAALVISAILTYDAVMALWRNVDGASRFGCGVGTAILFLNAALIASYVLGCHSLRHLAGGRFDRFRHRGASGSAYGIWRFCTWFNERHMLFSWLSLFSVVLADFYVYLVSQGQIADWNTWRM